MEENGLEISRPCVSLGRGEASARFDAGFCLDTAADALRECPGFGEVRISPRLGLLKTYGEARMLLFQDGQAVLYSFGGREDAYRRLKELGKILQGAALCPRNGGKIPARCPAPCPGGCAIAGGDGIPLQGEDS
jgi:hypothetical protein